jgi:hypothetical protein
MESAVESGRASPDSGGEEVGGAESLGEVVDRVARRITTSVVIAGAIIGLAVYARPAPPRYEAVIGDGQIVRIDTRSGSVIACGPEKCELVLKRGQKVERKYSRKASLEHKTPSPPQPALPKGGN